MSQTTATAPPDNPRPVGRRRGPFGGHVAATIEALQASHVDRKSPKAVALLAQLRAAAGSPPGTNYSVLDVTAVADQYIEEYRGDEATDTEHAKHDALTLFAIHQQSIHDRRMHIDGPGLGAAVARLAADSESAQAVRRRFAALGTASSYHEMLHYLRALIRQLRDKRIPLDYGLVADDLVAARKPGGLARIAARWGRDFYRVPATTETTGTEPGDVERAGTGPAGAALSTAGADA